PTSGRQKRWLRVFTGGSDHEAPLPKRWHVDVVGIGLQSSLLERLDDAPIRIAREHWRGALHDHQTLGAQVTGGSFVEGGGVELAERVVSGVREIDDDEIEAVRVCIDR